MKITFEKNMKVNQILDLFEYIMKEESEDYPILKSDMSIDILLKNDIGQISPNNERKISLRKADYEKIETEKKRYADDRLHEEWASYTNDYSYRELIKVINSDHRYIETAQEKNRSLQNIENRKMILLKNEKKLAYEKVKLESLNRFIDLVNKNKVKYEYIEYLPGCWSEIMIFELDETYIFEYNPDIIDDSDLRMKNS